MSSDALEYSTGRGDFQILLDGTPVHLPPGQRSLSGIRSYLEALALEQQRVLCSFTVDGTPAQAGQLPAKPQLCSRIEGQSFDLEHMPVELIRTARNQAQQAYREVQAGVALILINEGPVARECFWNLTNLLKQPLVTLNFLPEKLWGRCYGQVPVAQLRKWQLQQLGVIIREMDAAAYSEDPKVLAEALENRTVPWLENLMTSLDLWYETMLGGIRVASETSSSR